MKGGNDKAKQKTITFPEDGIKCKNVFSPS